MTDTLLKKYRLSLAQQDVFYDQLHFLGSPKYNIGGYVSLGRIDETKLRAAHAQVVRNNRMFGLHLLHEPAGVFVAIHPEPSTDLPLVDLSLAADPEIAAKEWFAELFANPFDLYGQTLFCNYLLKFNNDKYFYVAMTHHLMIDGWAIANWARQLGNYYSDIPVETEAEADFEAYFTQDFDYLSSLRYQRDKDFWFSYLNGNITRLLSPKAARPELQTLGKRSERVCIVVPSGLYHRLLQAAPDLSKSEHSLFVALAAVYFSRIAQKESLLIGVPAHNRRGAIQKQAIALYTSVSPVKVAVRDEESFLTLVDSVKAEQLAVFRHQRFPLGHMVRDLGPTARAGLFDIGVNFLKLDNKFTYGNDVAKICYVENHYQTTPFNMTVWDDGEGSPLQLQIDFNLDYFSADEVKAIGGQLLHIMSQVADNPGVVVSDLELVQPQEKLLVLSDSPNLAQDFEPIIILFEQRVAATPQARALCYREHDYSYTQLNLLAAQLAFRLHAVGVGAGDLVGLLLDRRPEMLIGILALYKLGAAYLPLDPSYPQARLAFMVKDSQCSQVLSVSALEWLSRDLGIQALFIDTYNQAQPTDTTRFLTTAASFNAHDRAYVIYTSGSTGMPKGVVLQQSALSNFLQSIVNQPGMNSEDCLLAITPFSFDISILELLAPLIAGGSVKLFHSSIAQDIAGFIADLQHPDTTMLQMTPSAWKILLAAGWQGNHNIKALIGGESLPAHLAESLVPKVSSLWNMYGPTETTIWSSCKLVQLPVTINSIGYPIANTRMLILDNKKRLLPIGCWGLLYIGGAGLAQGYWNRPELTRERFIVAHGDRWYETGDIARLLPSGEFEFQGRADHQVKLNGYRIELGEVEALLARYPGIINVVAQIKNLASGRQALCAYYQSEQVIPHELLKSALASQLPSYMVPSFYVHLLSFPQTPAGKTDMRALPEPEVMASSSPSSAQSHDAFTSNLLSIVRTSLHLDRLAPADNFFDVGATSMDVMELSITLNRELSMHLTVIDLFSHPSVKALGAYLQRDGKPASSQNNREAAIARGKSRLNNRLAARKLLDEV